MISAHQGYYSFIPSATLYIASRFDLGLVPVFTTGVSMLFWSLLIALINNGGGALSRGDNWMRCLLGLTIFLLLMRYQEIFLNTITLQFITPLILLILLEMPSENLSRNSVMYSLICICLLNGVPGLVFFPLVVLRFYGKNNYFLAVACAILVFQVYCVMHGGDDVSGSARIEYNLSYKSQLFAQPSLRRLLSGFLYFIYLIPAVYFAFRRKAYPALLFSCTFVLFLFTDLTKANPGYLAERYLAMLTSLTAFGIFVLANLTIKKKRLAVAAGVVVLLAVVWSSSRILKTDRAYCPDVPPWTREAKKLAAGKNAQIHPCGWNIPPVGRIMIQPSVVRDNW